jgi:hypothetical protein
VTPVLGPITIERAIYQCLHCGTSHAPLDRKMQIAAGILTSVVEQGGNRLVFVGAVLECDTRDGQ